ncbi:MAG TPA: response regulator transcription factor [Chthoniobacterales bacterium]|nr:response regulator transcription factor [Chthoniobacterales bacterium]
MSLAPRAEPKSSAHVNEQFRIAVVDDHTFFRELVCRQLARHSGTYRVVADAGTAAGATNACKAHKPDLLVLDINLPDRSGVAAVPDIKRASPRTRILLCTAFPAEDWIGEATTCGADGFVEKTSTWDDFMLAVDRVSRGQRYFSSGGEPRRSRVTQRADLALGLTGREREILKLIARGFTTKEIATQLFISVPTVETHRGNLMKKTGVRNVAGLVRFAVEAGLASN